jgi:transcription elongation factor GreA
MDRTIITKRGYQLLREKISKLEEYSKKITEKLVYAKIDGDLSENADWIVLKENWENNRDKINKMRYLLENSDVILKSDDKEEMRFIQIGSNVVYSILDDDSSLQEKTLNVEITSEIDSDPFIGKISHQSPFGSSLIGKEVGDIIEIISSNRLNNYKVKVLEIS